MRLKEMNDFLEPHLKVIGIPLDEVQWLEVSPEGYIIHFYYRHGDGHFHYHADIDGVPMGSLFVRYDS